MPAQQVLRTCPCRFLQLHRTFRDEWQRKYEPLASEKISSSHKRARELRQQQRQRQRQYRSTMPSSMADMYQMVMDMCEEQAESNMMSYSFGRYLSHSLQVGSNFDVCVTFERSRHWCLMQTLPVRAEMPGQTRAAGSLCENAYSYGG
jgi:hypothetical protein